MNSHLKASRFDNYDSTLKRRKSDVAEETIGNRKILMDSMFEKSRMWVYLIGRISLWF
jgi:hypothetical protein